MSGPADRTLTDVTPSLAPAALQAAARGALHPGPDGCGGCAAATLADRPDGTVVRHGATVAKAHAPDTDAARLRQRLAVAAAPALAGVLLPPLRPEATRLHGRLVTFWPHGTPVDPDRPQDAPWEAAATLLARLHATPADGLTDAPLPPMRGPVKAARALARLDASAPDHPAARPVRRAWRTLPPWARAEAPCDHARALCHGDLHLGQLVRGPAGPWLLIDIDDLGLGDPAWDLARPAAWFACGLLAPDDWTRFLTAYRGAGGARQLCAPDPWPALDVPARALTVQTAALAVAKAAEAGRSLDEVEVAVVDACDRMVGVPAPLGSAAAK
ncbi:phosphotransferase [Streptomyces sp. NPDC049813]|uniref:phosphotransferase n=1 Tax=Streptomyces sp. NPDC049813 TaxID=3365597 RepID=UPI0037B40441